MHAARPHISSLIFYGPPGSVKYPGPCHRPAYPLHFAARCGCAGTKDVREILEEARSN